MSHGSGGVGGGGVWVLLGWGVVGVVLVFGGCPRGGTLVPPCVLGHVDNPVGNPVDWLWITCGKVVVHTSNPLHPLSYPQGVVDSGWLGLQRKVGFSTYPQVPTIYYLDISGLVS